MAATYTWPGTLPQVVEKGFSESIGVNVMRTPMDAGPAKMRRRSAKPNTLNISFTLTTAQVSTLETFVQTTLRGTARFNFPHPRTGSTVEVRIVPQSDGSFYNLTYKAPGYYGVPMQLEIMP